MNILDISWPIHRGMVEYKDKAVVDIIQVKNFAQDGIYQSELRLSSHTGTHVDAPYHILRDGKRIEHIDKIVGPCKVLDLMAVKYAITADDLKQFDIEENNILLLKTKNSLLSATGFFNYDFVYLEASGAEYLAQKKVRAVGIDYLGLEREQPDHPSHKALLSAGISVIEGLRLEHTDPQIRYTLICLPLKMIGTEAAPARAILLY